MQHHRSQIRRLARPGWVLLLIGSAVIWSKLRLVGDVPRRAFAEPEAIEPSEPPHDRPSIEPVHPLEPWRESLDEIIEPSDASRVT